MDEGLTGEEKQEAADLLILLFQSVLKDSLSKSAKENSNSMQNKIAIVALAFTAILTVFGWVVNVTIVYADVQANKEEIAARTASVRSIDVIKNDIVHMKKAQEKNAEAVKENSKKLDDLKEQRLIDKDDILRAIREMGK